MVESDEVVKEARRQVMGAVMDAACAHWHLTNRTGPALAGLGAPEAAARAAAAVGVAADLFEEATRELQQARRELNSIVPESQWT